MNLTALRESFVRAIPLRSDQFESIQRELSKIIQEQQAKGNNGIVKTKYLTFGIDADNIRSAKPRLERIETDILNNFKRLGVSAEVLNGQERLRVLHDILRMDTPEPFTFRWEDLPRSGLSTKDYIAPSSFLFNRAKDFRMGKKFASVSFLQILAPELSDRILKDFLDIESNIVVNIHVQSVDQVSAIKTIKRTITDLDKSKIEEQKKAVRAGYDMDIIPSDLATYGAEAKKLLSDLQSRNQRTPVWEAMSTTALVNAAINGLGIAVLPHRMILPALRQGLICTVKVEGLSFSRNFHIIHHKDKFLTTSAKRFITLCRDFETDYPLPCYNGLYE